MSTTAQTLPPGYNELSAELQKNIQTLSKLPAAEMAKFQAKVNEHIAKADTKKSIMDEVKNLGKSVAVVNKAFEEARVSLSNVDKNNFKDKNGKPIPKLEPQWVGYKKRWTDFVWDSRAVATETEAYIRDFLNVIVPALEAKQFKDAKAELKAFVNRKDPFGHKLNTTQATTKAHMLSAELASLKADINKFRDSFKTYAADQKIALKKNIDAKKNQIKDLMLDIQKVERDLDTVGTFLAVTMVANAVGCFVMIFVALTPISPFAMLAIFGIGVGAWAAEMGAMIGLSVKRKGLQADLEAAQKELEALQKEEGEVDAARKILNQQVSANINAIGHRLDQFKAIWNSVAKTAKVISDQIDKAQEKDKTKAEFDKTIKAAKLTCTILADALALYAVNLGEPVKTK